MVGTEDREGVKGTSAMGVASGDNEGDTREGARAMGALQR